MKKFFKRFFNYAFLGKIDRTKPDSFIDIEELIPIEEVNLKNNQPPEQKPLYQELLRSKLITSANWVAVVVCLLSLAYIMIYSIVFPEKPVPDDVQFAFSSTLGYFIGIMTTFAGMDQKK